MEGTSANTIDGTLRITRASGCFSHTNAGANGESTSQGMGSQSLRDTLIAATVEVLAEGGVHRLGQSGRLRIPA